LDRPAPELAEMPAADVIGRAAAMLVGAAAERLGLADDGGPSMSSPHALEEARRLVAALDGLLAASAHHLDAHAAPLSDSVAALHDALRFRPGAAHPGQPEDRDPTDRGIS
ncbi:MAG TPA: hypothetical protein VGR21_01290, partial [Cryptosporangiaceae bacterium]|nr:hypothetical protein [Cryptosporangiaceae bacterium]